jgi:predicted ATPase
VSVPLVSTSVPRANLRFTRLDLANWRNFSSVQVDLERRVFLAGPNASGKSNFLDVFRFLHDIAAVGGGFQASVGARDGVSAIRSLAARRYSDIEIDVSVGTDEAPELWGYKLAFSQDNQRRPIIRQERVLGQGRVLLDRPDSGDQRDPERLTQTFLEQVNVNQKFRPVADFFASVKYLHIVPQLVREPDRSVGRANDPYGGDFLEQVARTPKRTQAARLRRIAEGLRVAVPQLQELELARDERGTPHLRGRYEHWRPKGAWQTETQFSDGTLRLLGLLWAVLDGTGPLLLEEPELSLHPEVVRWLPQMFARIQRRSSRQILTSTHSTDLLRDTGIGLDEVLLLIPSGEGAVVSPASSFEEVRVLLESGIPLAEAIMPRIRPSDVEQLALFGDW